MQSIKLNSRVGADGILRLDIPVDVKNADLEVVVTVNQIADSEPKNVTKSAWSSDFFSKTAGAWIGEPLKREAQGEYDCREELF